MIALMILFISNREVSPPKICTIIETGKYNLCKDGSIVKIKGDYSVGDVVELNGTFSVPSTRRSPFTFDFRNYSYSKNIYYRFQDIDSKVINHKRSIYEIREFVKTYIEIKNEASQKYLLALILGDKSLFTEEEKEMHSELGISHLFAISGLHVGLLCMILEKRLSKKVVSVIVLSYMVIAGFSPSITRAALMYVLGTNLVKYGFSSLDGISIVFLVLYLLNQNVIFDIGFQLSFLVTFFLLLYKPKQLLEVSIIAQLACFPILINMYNQLNLITVFVNIYFVVIMSSLVLPITFIEFIFPLGKIYEVIITLFERLVEFSNEFNMIIEMKNFHPLLIVLYYVLIRKPKLLVVIIVINMLLPIKEGIYFIDVGQGDATLIVDEDVYLIDTGGLRTYDIYKYEVRPLLRSLGISKIDYLVLTHSHQDHIKHTGDVLNDFNVNEIIVSAYAENMPYDIRVNKAHPGDIIGNLYIKGPSKMYKKTNNQSLMFIYRNNYSVFFMGDSELKESFGEVDVLKLGHHGSNTSLNKEILNDTRPEHIVISVGQNRYGLPSRDVLNMIENYNVYRTDTHGMVYYDGEMYSVKEYMNNFLGFFNIY